MKKFIPYIVSAIIAIQAFTPPVYISIQLTNSPLWFLWIFLLAGFLAFYFTTTKANVWVKALVVYLFLNSFLSKCPHLSMTAFVGVVACAYFYLLCLQLEDWSVVFKTCACILLVNLTFLVLQVTHHDTLLNFAVKKIDFPGAIGNWMELRTLVLLLVAITVQNIKSLEKHLYLVWAALTFLALVYWTEHKCWDYFCYARGAVWLDTLKLVFKSRHTFLVGYGVGTYKAMFPALAYGKYCLEGVWMMAHNTYLQFLFETGFVGITLLVAYTLSLLKRCSGLVLLGAALVGYTLMFQFPDRQVSSVPLLILFIAFIEQQVPSKNRFLKLMRRSKEEYCG